MRCAAWGASRPRADASRAFGASKRFGAAKTLPQAGLIPAEDDRNTGVPMEARFHGAELAHALRRRGGPVAGGAGGAGVRCAAWGASRPRADASRAFGASKRFGAAKTLPQAGLILAEDDGNTGVPMEARFHGAELEGLE